jgi:hypothetical protein
LTLPSIPISLWNSTPREDLHIKNFHNQLLKVASHLKMLHPLADLPALKMPLLGLLIFPKVVV